MNNYEDLIDQLTNGTNMPSDSNFSLLAWYSYITKDAADALKQLVAERDELVEALEKYRGNLDQYGNHSSADVLAKFRR